MGNYYMVVINLPSNITYSNLYVISGFPTGTYYWRLENISNATATGVFSGWWAELVNLGAG